MTRQQLQAYITETYGAVGECLWAEHPSFMVFRHLENRRWFAVLMDIPRGKFGLSGDGNISVVNVKCDPRLIGAFRMAQGIFPAYHMNKAHWLTVALEEVARDQLEILLDMSYELTKGKKK